MRAFQLVEWQKAPEFRDVTVPDPGPGEVVIDVLAAGACHSDLHLMDWPPGALPYSLPFTLGHENAGRVARLGSGVGGSRSESQSSYTARGVVAIAGTAGWASRTTAGTAGR